ncbi:MAG: type 1 glutamine amidotransferase, partial [Pseudomonadota bacterium]
PLYEDMFGGAAPEFRYRYYMTLEGELPAAPTECDAWLVTGSRHGVYDPLPWIEPLKDFLRATRAAGRPIIGICFGHQVVAEAFGGRATKFDGGWGLGRQDYAVAARPGWMADAPASLGLYAVHQDQVVALPEDATLLATNEHCAHAMVAYGDAETPDAVTVQPHPEFEAAFVADLARLIGDDNRAPGTVVDQALASLEGGDDNAIVAGLLAAYLRRIAEVRRAA